MLCGFYGCGKTSVGWELAKHMRRQFVDVPQELAKRARHSYIRMPPWARQPDPDEIEPQLVLDLAKRRDLVIALGAESLDNPDALAETHEFAFMVFLDPPLDAIMQRLRQMPDHRERLQQSGQSALERQLERRRGIYEQSDLQITEDLPPNLLARLILHCFYT